MDIILRSFARSAFLGLGLFASLSLFSQETRSAYFNPQNLPGDILWSNISWVDADGVGVAAPDVDTDVFLSGPRASSYRHVIVQPGSDITMNSLTLANSNWGSNSYKALEINGTAENLTSFTVKNDIKVTQNFNSIYVNYTKFSAGNVSLAYYARMSFANSTVNMGEISGANMASLAFNASDSTLAKISFGNGGIFDSSNSSKVKISGDYYSGGMNTLSADSSEMTIGGNYVCATQSIINLTNSKLDINYGMRMSNETLTLKMRDSSLIVRNSTYNGTTSSGIAVGAGKVATIELVNSTIDTGRFNIDIINANSTIDISMLEASNVAITCGNLNFTGEFTVDFSDSTMREDADYTLISASNAGDMFNALLDNDKVFVNGLLEGESYSWIISTDSVILHFSGVPEPSTYALIFGSFALALIVLRRKRK